MKTKTKTIASYVILTTLLLIFGLFCTLYFWFHPYIQVAIDHELLPPVTYERPIGLGNGETVYVTQTKTGHISGPRVSVWQCLTGDQTVTYRPEGGEEIEIDLAGTDVYDFRDELLLLFGIIAAMAVLGFVIKCILLFFIKTSLGWKRCLAQALPSLITLAACILLIYPAIYICLQSGYCIPEEFILRSTIEDVPNRLITPMMIIEGSLPLAVMILSFAMFAIISRFIKKADEKARFLLEPLPVKLLFIALAFSLTGSFMSL